MAKRVVRLDPPYFATIAVWLLYLSVVSRTSLHRGAPFRIDAVQLLGHIGYINAFIGRGWYLDTFWTLAIEFQYYITVGLLFPLIASRRLASCIWIYILTAAAALMFPQNPFLLHHLPLFLMGIVIFRFRCMHVSRSELIAGMLFAIVLTVFTNGWLQMFAGAGCALVILLVHYSNFVFKFLGDISYSLYLTHGMIVSVVGNQGSRFLGTSLPMQLVIIVLGMSLSIAAAFLMFWLVERPAKNWASKITYARARERFSQAASA